MRSAPAMASLALALALAACSSVPRVGALVAPAEPEGRPRGETLVGVSASHQLVRFDAGTPRTMASKAAIAGLEEGDALVGLDWRASRRELLGLGIRGRLYVIDAATAKAQQVLVPAGEEVALVGNEFGFDVEPLSGRARIVSDVGMNQRISAETGAAVDSDPGEPGLQPDGPLRYAPGDEFEGRPPRLLAIASSPAGVVYGIDARNGTLVTLGSGPGAEPVVSPIRGRLFTVGHTGLAEVERVGFAISAATGAGYAAFTPSGAKESRLYLIDLSNGRATFLGTIAAGEPLRALAVLPR